MSMKNNFCTTFQKRIFTFGPPLVSGAQMLLYYAIIIQLYVHIQFYPDEMAILKLVLTRMHIIRKENIKMQISNKSKYENAPKNTEIMLSLRSERYLTKSRQRRETIRNGKGARPIR